MDNEHYKKIYKRNTFFYILDMVLGTMLIAIFFIRNNFLMLLIFDNLTLVLFILFIVHIFHPKVS